MDRNKPSQAKIPCNWKYRVSWNPSQHDKVSLILFIHSLTYLGIGIATKFLGDGGSSNHSYHTACHEHGMPWKRPPSSSLWLNSSHVSSTYREREECCDQDLVYGFGGWTRLNGTWWNVRMIVINKANFQFCRAYTNKWYNDLHKLRTYLEYRANHGVTRLTAKAE